MPLQRRLPKIGFTSRVKELSAQVRLDELSRVDADVIDLGVLISKKLVPAHTKIAKVIKSGEVSKALNLKGLKITAGAKAQIEAAGGRVEV
jgi:large subunit ribosomal protein L15